MPSAARREPTSTFLASMPVRYRTLFDSTSAREHAAIVERRGDSPVHAELWKRLPRGRAVACVVAADRPGLLSCIAASLVVHGLDVEAAQAFTRETTGEAIDLFWLRRDAALPSPVLEADIDRVSAQLRELVTGRTTIDALTSRMRARPAATSGTGTHVRFEETDDGGVAVLTVETFDRPGLLLGVTRALHRARVQIIASEATTDRGRVVDRFSIVELDGAPLRASRRGLLQMEVLGAIDALRHGGG
jgi:[protein-PII] uridylyltransferase